MHQPPVTGPFPVGGVDRTDSQRPAPLDARMAAVRWVRRVVLRGGQAGHVESGHVVDAARYRQGEQILVPREGGGPGAGGVPSLVSRCSRWVDVVRRVAASRSAIPTLLDPQATSVRTSSSRSVRPWMSRRGTRWVRCGRNGSRPCRRERLADMTLLFRTSPERTRP